MPLLAVSKLNCGVAHNHGSHKDCLPCFCLGDSVFDFLLLVCCWRGEHKDCPTTVKNLDDTMLFPYFSIILFFLLLLLLVKNKLYIKEKNINKIGFQVATSATPQKMP